MTTLQVSQTAPSRPAMDELIPSVLIVDDERALRMVLRRAIEGEGYRTTDVSSGEHCLLSCQQTLPDLILLDAVMPGMDGFECCKRLQQSFRDRCPPVLIITALHDQESVDRAFAAGATDFITKPIHWAVLRQRVQRLLRSCQLTTEWQACLTREQTLRKQLEIASQKVTHLTELCQENGIAVD